MDSKYQRWYDEIIERARSRELDCYKERHHILPRSLGGSDDPINLVDLTYREHFLVHWLLTKIYDGDAKRAMVSALFAMTVTLSGRIRTSWQFEVAKRAVKREVLKRANERREALKAKRKQYVSQIETAKQAVLDRTAGLKPIGREELGLMSNAWLAADINRLRKRGFLPPAPKRPRLRKSRMW